LHTLPGFHSETIVVVTVPAYQFLFCSHDEWLEHYRRYSVKMLQQCLHQAKFTSIKSGYFFSTLLLPRILQKTKERFIKSNTKNVTGIGDWSGGGFLSTLIKNILLFDYKFSKILRCAGVKLPGLSCYGIFKSVST
jgi:hypothetical protein